MATEETQSTDVPDRMTATRAELLRRTPQGVSAILYAGSDQGFGGRYLSFSPNSRAVSIPTTDARLLDRLDADHAGARFDAMVLDGIADGVADAVSLLAGLRSRAEAGAVLTIAVNNPSHWREIEARLKGEATIGTLSAASLTGALQSAGWTLLDTLPVPEPETEANPTLDALVQAAEIAGVAADVARDRLTQPTLLVRAINGPIQPRITVAALGLRKMAGVTDARVDHPMAALASRPFVRAVWNAGGIHVPASWAPGVLILHRQFLDKPPFIAAIEARIAKGWTIVSEMDDDPHHWPQYGDANFRAFRGVHAVTVSTEPLAEIIRPWNPNVHVLANAAPYLPPIPDASPKSGGKVRVFFGALNRGDDWAAIVKTLTQTARTLAREIEFLVVHDRAFFDALPTQVDRRFAGTQPYDGYMDLLASCDVALLPLNDTPFNRLKSDIKFVECCAAGVVPICSPTLYAEDHQDRDIALFSRTPQEWADALTHLVKDKADRERRRDRARAYAQTHRMHADQAAGREQLFRDMMQDRSRLEDERQARIANHFPA